MRQFRQQRLPGRGCAVAVALLVLTLGGGVVSAQPRPGQAPARAAPPAAPAAPAAPAPEQAPPAEPAAASLPRWEQFSPMQLERVFRGPLNDTVVQRWRDPVDGATCFIYLPMSAAISSRGQHMVYGSNTIGSISCFGNEAQTHAAPLPNGAAQPPARSR